MFVEVSVNGSKLTNIMKYSRFFKTRDEAEAALAASAGKEE